MNLEALRFWRHIHRYLLGLTVLVELIWILYGKPLSHWKPREIVAALNGLGAGEGILLVVALLLAGIIGGTFCELALGLVDIFRGALGKLFQKPWLPKKLRLSRDLILTTEELTIEVLQENLDFVVEHLSLYHLATSGPEHIEQVKKYEEQHLQRVRNILLFRINPTVRIWMTYAFQVTQERREVDNQRTEEEIVTFSLFAVVLALVLSFMFLTTMTFCFVLAVGFLCLWGGAVRIIRLRIRLASYMAALTLMQYALAEGADVVDRDAF